MLLRLLGIGLLVLVSIPLIIAVPPLIVVPLLLLVLGARRGPTVAPRRRQQPKRDRPAALGARRQSRRGRPASSSRARTGAVDPTLRRMVVWLIGGLAVFAVLRALVEEYPREVAVVGIIGLGIAMLIWRRRRARRMPVWSGAAAASHALPASTVAAGTAFEWHVVDILCSLGYRDIERVGGAGDNGIDIVANDSRGMTFLVQCKNFTANSKVGSVDIQKLLGAVVHHGADGGMFFTTSAYTPAAIQLANSGRIPITLFDGQQVARLSR